MLQGKLNISAHTCIGLQKQNISQQCPNPQNPSPLLFDTIQPVPVQITFPYQDQDHVKYSNYYNLNYFKVIVHFFNYIYS